MSTDDSRYWQFPAEERYKKLSDLLEKMQSELERLRKEVEELKARPEEKPWEPYAGELCRMYDKELERWLIVYAHAPWNGEFQPLLDPNIIQLREHDGSLNPPDGTQGKSGWLKFRGENYLREIKDFAFILWPNVTHYAVVEDA